MTKQDMEIKMNGWTFEETVKTAENLMESERNMFRWDALRHLRDFAELFFEELRQYREIGTPEECRAAVEKQRVKKPIQITSTKMDGKIGKCPCCGSIIGEDMIWCDDCGQKLDWSGEE